MIKPSTARIGGVRKLLHPITIILLAAILLFALSLWSWWQFVFNSPDKIFWGMVQNNLRTSAFSRTTIQDDGQQQVAQVTETTILPTPLANNQTTIIQPEAKVVTESVGTPFRDYVRYTNVSTSRLNAAGKPMDFSSVLNVWGASTADNSVTGGQLFNKTVLGIVPMGIINAQDRAEVYKAMHDNNVYVYTKAKTVGSGLRRTYVYDVKVNPVAYVTVLKTYAETLGLTHLKTIEPSQYESTQPISVQLSVDSLSRQLTEVSYGNGARRELYTAFGSTKQLQPAPTKTIGIDELQYRLQTIQ